MIHILLLILKVIGIVLLILLALALLVLFFPVTYIGKGQYIDKKAAGQLTAGWFFHIVHFKVRFEGKNIRYKLRVFGISVISSEKKNKKDDKKESSDNKAQIQQLSDAHKANNKDSEETNEKQDKIIETEKIREDNNQNFKTEDKKKFVDKLKDFFNNIKDKFKSIFKKITELKDKTKEIKSFITAQTTKEAYRYGKKIIVKLLKHILPKKIQGNVHFGFEEPHTTGEVLGYIAMGFATFKINPKYIVIEPDFENEIFEGKLKCRGRIFLVIVGIYILKFYFKKEIHHIIKKYI